MIGDDDFATATRADRFQPSIMLHNVIVPQVYLSREKDYHYPRIT